MTAVETRPDPSASGPSLPALAGELSEEVRQLARLEVELAKAELGEAVGHAKQAGAGFGAAAVLGYLALLLGSFALAFGLAEIMPTWLAFLVVALAWGVGAAIGYSAGRRNLRSFDPVPHRTITTLKEDVAWLRHRTS